jgi:hypothetical protein
MYKVDDLLPTAVCKSRCDTDFGDAAPICKHSETRQLSSFFLFALAANERTNSFLTAPEGAAQSRKVNEAILLYLLEHPTGIAAVNLL